MKGKLIKTDVNYLLEDDKGLVIASTSTKEGINGLSKQNCDEIFGVVDVEKLAEYSVQEVTESNADFYLRDVYKEFFKEGFNKAMELNKDKLFTLEDMKRAIDKAKQGSVKETHNGYGRPTERRFDLDDLSYDEIIQSLQQPAEIEVEIEMICPHPMDTYRCGLQYGCDGDGCNHPNQIPYLDSEGCLILKRI
jgi:hypothetical protein